MSKRTKLLLVIFTLIVMGGLVATLPPVRDSLSYHFEDIKTRIRYALYPPAKVVFVPQAAVATAVQATVSAFTPVPSATSIPPTATPPPQVDTATPAPTAPPLPAAFAIQGVKYINQHGLWNYCAPSNLAMELSYWGWTGTREDIGNVVKPFPEDKNVMPYELADYVTGHTNLSVALRYGGTLDLLKRLVSNGYAVLIEKGTFITDTTGTLSWMGHYNVVTGYSDTTKEIIVQDSYFKPDMHISYDTITEEWRAFDNVFLVVYPADKEQNLMTVLGDYADADNANRIAAKHASDESYTLTGNDQFFALFNRGTSLVNLQDYAGAASAYDAAFKLYPSLVESKRPWRMMWYQTGPYFAYYYMGRYQDVINLATQTIDYVEKPYLEESFYWRGRARAATGDVSGDISDQRTALTYHPGFQPVLDELNRLGVGGGN